MIIVVVRWDGVGVVFGLSAVLVVGVVIEVGVVDVVVDGLFAILMFGVDVIGGLVLGVLLLVSVMLLSMVSLLGLLLGQPRCHSLSNLSQIGRGLLSLLWSLSLLTVVLTRLMFVLSGGGGCQRL